MGDKGVLEPIVTLGYNPGSYVAGKEAYGKFVYDIGEESNDPKKKITFPFFNGAYNPNLQALDNEKSG